MGYVYYHGEGREQNFDKALEWFERAASHGKNSDADALFMLGAAYNEGEIVERDVLKAISYYEKAAYLENFDAWDDLAELARSGIKEAGEAYERMKNRKTIF